MEHFPLTITFSMRLEIYSVATFLATAVLFSGCVQAPRPLYYWGNYEESLYATFSKPDKMPPAQLVEKLREDLAKAEGKGFKPNPGCHAELGLALLELGQSEEALKHFEAEKALFPESAPFMDRMISKLKGGVK